MQREKYNWASSRSSWDPDALLPFCQCDHVLEILDAPHILNNWFSCVSAAAAADTVCGTYMRVYAVRVRARIVSFGPGHGVYVFRWTRNNSRRFFDRARQRNTTKYNKKRSRRDTADDVTANAHFVVRAT